MSRFLCLHTLPPGGISPDDLRQAAEAGQHDPLVRGYRSFANLTEGRAACIIDAPNAKAVGDWFDRMKVPYDSITEVEFEGERGEVTDLKRTALAA